MPNEVNTNIEKETIVVTTEQGVVLTGTRVEAFEARIMQTVRKPIMTLALLMTFLFVLILGLSVIITRLNTTVNRTDRIVRNATSPESAAEQQKVVTNLASNLNCSDQRNLQKLVDNLVAAGMSSLKNVESVVEPQCKAP